MDSCQKKDLMELMELDFSLLETSLFLDTHPNDTTCIQLHNSLAQKCMVVRTNYVRKYGPLSSDELLNHKNEYLCTPWPWDTNFAHK